jgi:hypothetical protein
MLSIEGLGARTAQLEDLQFWENAKENLTVPTKYTYNSQRSGR